ncbi:MAG: HD domain-containing protein [Lachnospiraceae bacterium]|nr:HD domain-containing protein [Lachnospiraceae bacterium]
MLVYSQLRSILNSGIALTTEKDRNKLYEMLISTAMSITNCDAGTLYLYKDNSLSFKIMKTLSQNVSRGENGEEIDLPPVPLKEENVCAYAAIHRKLVNVPDVYHSTMFDFSGPKKYDSITGYHTESMLVIPLMDAEETLVGVLQLINAIDRGTGKVIPFDSEDEFVIRSLGSMAAVMILNAIYIEQIRSQLHSFVNAFATAVDERTPYNGEHTRKVTIYTGLLIDSLNERFKKGEQTDFFFEKKDRVQLLMAAALHDVGKMVVPLSVMNKDSRLGNRLEDIQNRFELLAAYYDLDHYKGKITDEEKLKEQAFLKDSLEFIQRINKVGFLTDEDLARTVDIAGRAYCKPDGSKIPFLTAYEAECLSIRRGTLTDEERKIIQSHVEMTKQILEKVQFNKEYRDVIRLAVSHHEMLDGSGYPNHLKADQLDAGSRILAVTDIYDALTSADRPYKTPIPRPKAFAILKDMAKEGKLDGRLVNGLEIALSRFTDEEIKAITADRTHGFFKTV